MTPHIALWPGGAYRPLWGVWRTRAACRAGGPPVALAYFREGLAAAQERAVWLTRE